VPARPPAALHQLAPRHDAPRAGEDERPCKIGGRLGGDVGGVGDRDAPQLGRDQVYVVVAHATVGDDLELGEVLEFRATDPARAERHDRDVVAPQGRLVGGDPRDVESGQLRGLEQRLELGRQEDAVTHYLLSWARRIESSSASAPSGLHL